MIALTKHFVRETEK